MRVKVNYRSPLLLCAVALVFMASIVGFYRSQQQGQTFNSAGINEQLNFQARLLTGTGAVVPDGFYNLRFKVYQDGDGCEVSGTSPCGGTLEWTETRDSTNKVRVKNGYFSVYLGSVTPFGTDVDWNQDSLWLSIDVGGTGGSPSWDGEMLPFSRFSATPYAKNTKRIGGLTKDELVQLGQNAIQVDSSTNDSIAINKTGASGDILQLQRGGSDVLLINNSGELLFKPQTNSTSAFRIQNADGSATVVSADTTNKRVGINNVSPGASLQVQGSSASEIVSIIQGNDAAQTGDLQQLLNSSNDILGRIDAGGNIVAALDPPSTAATAAVDATAGNLNGDYSYIVTFVTAQGETYAGPVSNTVSPSNEQVDVSAIPTGPTGTKARKIYRTTRQVDGVTTNWRFLTQISDNTTTTYNDNTADTGLTYSPPMPIAPPQVGPQISAALSGTALTGNYQYAVTYVTPWGETPAGPTSNTFTAAGQAIALRNMAFGGVKNVSAMRVYRTQAGGSTYYYNPTLRIKNTSTDTSGTITDSSVTARDDNNADGSLNTNITPPTAENTSNRPAAPSASLITSAGNLNQNVDYVWAYTYVNASGAESALSPMSGTVSPDGTGQQASVTGITAGPPGTVARKIYRSFLTNQDFVFGGTLNEKVTGVFMQVATIGNNSTTTYTDNTADNGLTVSRPPTSGFVGSGILTNNIKLAAPQGSPPITVTSTTMVKNLNVELLGGNDQQGIKDFTYNIDESLKHFRSSLANANSEAVVVNFIGDSITWGLSISDRATKSTPALVEKALKDKYGDGGTGFQKPQDNRLWTFGADGTYTNGIWAGGAGAGQVTMCNADDPGIGGTQYTKQPSMTIQFRGTKLAIQYTDNAFAYDSFTYNVDDGAKTGTVTHSSFGTYGMRTIVDGLDPNKLHTVVLNVVDNGNTADQECAAIEGIDAMFDTGIRVNNVASSGTTTHSAFAEESSAIASFDPDPDLVVFAYGTNEQGGTTPAAFKESYQKWIGQAKGLSQPADCILVVPAPQDGDSAGFSSAAHRDVIYQLADENGCGVLDLWRKWGGDFAWAEARGLYNDGVGNAGTIDGLHLSDKGAADVASSFIGFLDKGVKLNNSLTVDSSFTQQGGSFSVSELTAPQNLRAANNSATAAGTLTSGDTYRYRVTAVNSSGESIPSDEEVFTVTTGSGFTADNIISMRWDVVPGATKYRLYRCFAANCASGTPLSQYVETGNTGIVDNGTLNWVTNVTPPTSNGNSSFAGALLQGNSSSALNVANSDGGSVIKVDTSANPYNLIRNSGFESDSASNMLNNPSFETESGNWVAKGAGSVGRGGDYVYDKSKSLVLATTAAANDGVKYNQTLPNSTSYEFSFWARTIAGSGAVLAAGYANDGSTETNCSLSSTTISTTWTQYSCIVTTTTVSGTPYLFIKQTDATSRYIVVDKASFKPITAPSGWETTGSTARVYHTDTQKYAGNLSLRADTIAAANDGVKYPITLESSTQYSLSFRARTSSIMFGTIAAGYASDGSTESNCTLSSTIIVTTGWGDITCTFTTGTVSGTPYLYVKQSDAVARSIYLDAISLVPGSAPLSYTLGSMALNGTVTSPLLIRNSEDSTTALQVQNAAGSTLFGVNATLGAIAMNGAVSVSGSVAVTGTATVSANLTADSINVGGTNLVTSGLEVVKDFTSSSSCTFGCYGAFISSIITNPSSPTSAVGLRVATGTGAASFTTPNAYGIFVDPIVKGSGSTITSGYGILVQAQTAATSNYGVAIQAAGTQTLWVSSDADNTTPEAGIAFGSSRNALLYRGGAGALFVEGRGGGASGTGSSLTLYNRYNNDASQRPGVVIRAEASSNATGSIQLNLQGSQRFTLTANGSTGEGAVTSGRLQVVNTGAGFTGLTVRGASGQSTNLQEWQINGGTVVGSVGATGDLILDPSALSSTALAVRASGANVLQVDTAVRSGSGGNLVKIGNSTGTDGDTTILQLDSATADPTSNLSALNGGLFYDSTSNKVKIIENGTVKTLCNTTDAGCGAGGSGARLDQVTAATTGASINNADNNVVWNWQLTGAESGFTFGENAASTGGGTQNQFLLDIATLSTSTASPMRVTSNSADGGDIVFNLASNGDIEFQDNGTAFLTLSDTGAYSYTLDATDNPTYTITNSGSGNITTNLAGTGDYVIQDNGTAVFTVADSGNIDTAYTSTNTTAGDEYSLTVTTTDTGVVTTGTDNTYGQRVAVSRTGATGGTTNAYGVEITTRADSSGAGTSTANGLVANAAGAASGTADFLYGIKGGAIALLTGNVTEAVAVRGEIGTFLYSGTITEASALQGQLNIVGAGTVTEGFGLQIQSAAINASTIAANYGIKVEAQTAGTSDYGIAIDAADTQTLWISSNADNSTANAGIAFGASRDTNLYRLTTNTLATDGIMYVGTALQVGAVSSELLRVGADTTLARDQYKVTIGRGDSGYPEGLARDQLYVFGRINSSWQQWWNDCLVSQGTLTATGVSGGFTRSANARLVTGTSVASTSGICRADFTGTLAAGNTGYWGAGATLTQRSLNPVIEGRLAATTNTDHRVMFGFHDIGTTTAIAADTNQSANEAFFRKQAGSTTWEVVSRVGSGTEQVTTTALGTGTYRVLRVELDDTAAAVRFYADGTLVATHTTAVPATGTRLNFGLVFNISGTTNRATDVDYVRVWSDDPKEKSASNEGTAEFELVEAEPIPVSFNIAGQQTVVDEREIEASFGKLKADEIFAGTIFADRIKANQIEGLELLVDRIASRPVQTGEDTQEPDSELATETIDLKNFQPLTITTEELTVNGPLFANGALKVMGPADFFGNSIFHRMATFIDTAIFRNDVEFQGVATFNSDAAGFAVIEPAKQTVKVEFEKAYEQPPVVTLTVKNGVFADYAYKDLNEEGFTIILKEPTTEKVEFAWTAVSVKEVKTSQNDE